MSLKEWLLVIGALLIGAILFDGIRRARKRSRLKIRIDDGLKDLRDDEYNSELPNGGARVISSAPPVHEEPSFSEEALVDPLQPEGRGEPPLIDDEIVAASSPSRSDSIDDRANRGDTGDANLDRDRSASIEERWARAAVQQPSMEQEPLSANSTVDGQPGEDVRGSGTLPEAIPAAEEPGREVEPAWAESSVSIEDHASEEDPALQTEELLDPAAYRLESVEDGEPVERAVVVEARDSISIGESDFKAPLDDLAKQREGEVAEEESASAKTSDRHDDETDETDQHDPVDILLDGNLRGVGDVQDLPSSEPISSLADAPVDFADKESGIGEKFDNAATEVPDQDENSQKNEKNQEHEKKVTSAFEAARPSPELQSKSADLEVVPRAPSASGLDLNLPVTQLLGGTKSSSKHADSVAKDEPVVDRETSSVEEREPSSVVEKPSTVFEEPSALIEEPSASIKEPSAPVGEPFGEVDESSAEIEGLAAETAETVERKRSSGPLGQKPDPESGRLPEQSAEDASGLGVNAEKRASSKAASPEQRSEPPAAIEPTEPDTRGAARPEVQTSFFDMDPELEILADPLMDLDSGISEPELGDLFAGKEASRTSTKEARKGKSKKAAKKAGKRAQRDAAKQQAGDLRGDAGRRDLLAFEEEPAPEAERKAPSQDEVLVITVTAQQEPFSGRALQKLAEACGMCHGEMQIFHRHEDAVDSGPVQFSMANAVKPGFFDLDNIEDLKTPAVSFFLAMPEPRDLMNAFECMLATAKCVANNLGGELKDEHRSVMRPQTIEHYRQRIRDFELHRLRRRT